MARNTGTFEFPSNFEVKKAAPLDARAQTGLKSELTGLPFPYKGMIVSVTDDTTENNGTYVLENSDGSSLDDWKKIASTTVSSMTFQSDVLKITMSDGVVHQVTIQTSAASVSAPTGETGTSAVNRTINNVPGKLTFSSSSEQ